MIPKIIHQTWRDHELAPDLAKLTDSWRFHNADWEYRFWNDDDLSTLVKDKYPELWGLFQAAPIPVQKSDIARYLILHRFGGIYADIDTECFGSLEPLVKENRVILCQEPPEHWEHASIRNMKMLICNATMASPAGHPFWVHIMKVLNRCRHAKKSALDATGPLMLTGAYNSYAQPDKIALHSCHLFSPLTKDREPSQSKVFGPLAPNCLSSHLWQGSWFPQPNDNLKKTTS